jgi:NADH/NAD ratio-sensing transcriptional regulator Rex
MSDVLPVGLIETLAVPAENAQTVCDAFAATAITAILNIAPLQMKVPPA